MMKRLAVALALTVSASVVSPVAADAASRASLAGLSRIGAVIITAPDDAVAESEVRRAIERRLAQANIPVDGAPGPELLVSVSAERYRAESGLCECGTFRVSVSLREPVLLERAPERGSIAVTTWSSAGAIHRFSRKAPRLGILDMVEDGISAFLRALASDSLQSDPERQQP